MLHILEIFSVFYFIFFMLDCHINNIIMPMSIQMVGPIKSHDMNNIMPMSMILSFSFCHFG